MSHLLRLYTYFRSSAAYRVRIALNLKGLPYEAIPVHLLRNGGEQHSPAHAARSPAGLIPVLQEEHFLLGQSLAIIEYLEECHPSPPLLPQGSQPRARVRAYAQAIACDIHPLNNLRVLKYLKQLGIEPAQRRGWSQHWMLTGLHALERQLQSDATSGRCCYGDTPTLADCCVIPQLFNARRLDCDLTGLPLLQRIEAHCLTLPAFQQAAPDAQPDSE